MKFNISTISKTSFNIQTASRGCANYCNRPPLETAQMSAADCVIIGAGFAGLAAATSLAEAGVRRITVLEASERVGGRAHTLHMSPELSIELGATWIHGIGPSSDQNPVLKIAAAAGLMPASAVQTQRWWASRYVREGTRDELTNEEELVVQKAVRRYAAAVDENGEDELKVPADFLSVGQVLDASWKELRQGLATEREEKLASAAWAWRDQLQSAIAGCDSSHDAHAVAYAAYTEYADSEQHAPVPCGYQAVAEAMATKFSQSCGASLLLGHAVERVEWRGWNGENGGGVTVHCTDGTQVKASAAVVTVSVGVLKARHAEMFRPALPAPKIEAIERMRIGSVDKVVINFAAGATPEGSSEPAKPEGCGGGSDCGFGDADENVLSYALLWDTDTNAGGVSDEELPAWARGVFNIRFGGPEFKRRRQQNPAAAEHSDNEGERVADQGVSDEDVPPPLGPPRYQQAVVWLTGAAARAMEADSEDGVLQGMRAIFARFPGIELPQGASWEAANTVVRSRWAINPFTRGSYSYVGVDGSTVDPATIAAGVSEQGELLLPGDGWVEGASRPVLAFAGEACHLKYIGTTHAAVLTGRQAAASLLASYHSAWGVKAL